MKLAKHHYLGMSDNKNKLASGIKLSTAGPRKFTPPEKPLSFTSLPADASRVKWECCGTGVRARFRKGWLVSRENGTFHYLPDEPTPTKSSPSFGSTPKKPADRQSASDAKRQRVEGGFLHRTNSGGIAFQPDPS